MELEMLYITKEIWKLSQKLLLSKKQLKIKRLFHLTSSVFQKIWVRDKLIEDKTSYMVSKMYREETPGTLLDASMVNQLSS
jgi:hypothetical protein